MNRKNLSIIIGIFFMILFGFSSCNSNEPILEPIKQNQSVTNKKENFISNPQSLRSLTLKYNNLDPVVVDYFDNIKTMIYATNALNIDNNILDKIEEPNVNEIDKNFHSKVNELYSKFDDSNIENYKNPMSIKLGFLDIKDAENNRDVNFFDMQEEEKKVFIDYLLIDEAEILSKKLKIIPELKEVLEKENEITYESIKEMGLTELSVGQLDNSTRALASYDNVKKVDAKNFFDNLNSKLLKENLDIKPQNKLRGLIEDYEDYPRVDKDVVVQIWANNANKGDIVLALPVHKKANSYINEKTKYQFGHVGIIVRNIRPFDEGKYVTIEAFEKDGVKYRNIYPNWESYHYILRFQNITRRWKWNWFRSGWQTIYTEVTNKEPFINKAKEFIGKPYLYSKVEHLYSKLLAPKRFNCASLVWYCLKDAHGINISDWYKPLITPSGVYTSPYTDLKKEIGEDYLWDISELR